MKKETVNTSPTPGLMNTGMSFIYRGSDTKGNQAISVIIHTLFSYIITLLLSFGALFTFTTMFSIKCYETWLLVVTALYGLAMVIIFQLNKKFLKYIMLGITVIFVAVCLIFWKLALSGLDYIKDFLVVAIAKSMFWSEPVLSYEFTEAMKTDTTFPLCLLAVLITTGAAFFTVRKINFIFAFLVTFPFFEIGAAFGCVPNHIWFGILLAGWMGIFAMHAAIAIRKIKKRKQDKKKSKLAPVNPKKTLISSIGVTVAAITFVVFAFSNYVVGIAGYNRPENMKLLRSNFKTYVSDFIDYIIGVDNDGSLREGRLYQMGDRIIKNRRYLTVEGPLRTKTYLRGYIGANYMGDSWEPSETNEWLETSYKSSGYYPQNMQGKALQDISDSNVFVQSSAATITISNLRRKKDYAYTTYIPYLSDEFSLSGDYMIEPSNKSKYSYNAYVDTGNLYMLNTSDLFDDKEFSSVWKEYTKYVKETYTKFPSGMAEINNIVDGLKAGTGYGYEGKGVSQSNLEIADRIRGYLAANIEYSLTTPQLPKDTDFVNWFLFENKKGYSAHYATAMALMLRMAGVPSRYVEGYYLTPEDYENSTALKGGYYSVDVTDANAHAWVEIYESNYGWIPVEATPSFFEGSLIENLDTSDFDKPEISDEDNEYLHNDDTEIAVPQYSIPNPVLPELKLETVDEDKDLTNLQIIFKAIKYLYVFVGLTILAFVCMLIVAFIILVIRRAVRLSKLKRSIFTGNTNQNVVAIYKYYSRLLIYEGINQNEQIPYMELAEKICKNCKNLRGEQHIRAMSIFLKHRFSDEDITENELQCLKNIIVEYRKTSMKAISGEKKFIFMFIDNLG